MRFAAAIALVASLSSVPARADVVITAAKHSDAVVMMGQEQPATDTVEVTWFGQDRMRIEEGERVTIVRTDLKKMFMLDTAAKTVSTIELPFDLKKYVPAEQFAMMEPFLSQMKATLTPTTETKKIKDWNATKYTMSLTMPMGGGVTQEMWVTKDVELDQAAFNEMQGAMMSTAMGGGAMVGEMKKLEGVVLLTERTLTMMGQASKSREEVTSIEKKDATEGLYEVPKDYTEKPFDPLADSPMGGGGRPRGGKPGGAPPEKPKDKP